jgi:IS30 family transposase
MKKQSDRKLAEDTFLGVRGQITNKDLARKLGIHPATIARWKKLDEWDRKLVQVVTEPNSQDEEDEYYASDLRHLTSLNEKIEKFLERKELQPSEILELAEAKYHIMTCMEIIYDRMNLPLNTDYGNHESEFD